MSSKPLLDPERIAEAVITIVAAAMAPRDARIKALESQIRTLEVREPQSGRDGQPGLPGRDGKDADMAALKAFIEETIAHAVAALPVPVNGIDGRDGRDGTDGRDGHSFTLDDVQPVIATHVAKAMADIPLPQNGQDGKDGTSVDATAVEAWIAARVKSEVATIPVPKDGQDGQGVTVDDLAPMVEAVVERHVKAIPIPKDGRDGVDGKDGVGLASALIDRDGALVVTLTNGEKQLLGRVIGRDGIDGTSGLDGKDGRDGTDAVGFALDQMLTEGEFDPETRTITWRLQGSDKTLRVKLVGTTVHRGVYDSTRAYEAGDQVTHASSQWIAKRATMLKPDETGDGARDWVLCVKRGREGREGKPGKNGKDGLNGKDGRNLTPFDPRG